MQKAVLVLICPFCELDFWLVTPSIIERYHMVPRISYLSFINNYFDAIINEFTHYKIKLVIVFDGASNQLKKTQMMLVMHQEKTL